MKKILLITFMLLLTEIQDVYGYVYGETNFDFLGYPDPSCSEPFVPYGGDSASWKIFKIEFEEYARCIERYLEGAQNDQKRIIEKANEVIDGYNLFVNSIN